MTLQSNTYRKQLSKILHNFQVITQKNNPRFGENSANFMFCLLAFGVLFNTRFTSNNTVRTSKKAQLLERGSVPTSFFNTGFTVLQNPVLSST